MKLNEIIDLQNDILKYIPSKYKQYNIEKALTFYFMAYDRMTLFSFIKCALAPIFKYKYKISETRAGCNGKTLFFCGTGYMDRADQIKSLESVANLGPGYYLKAIYGNNVVHVVKLWRIFLWYYRIKNVCASSNLKWYISLLLYQSELLINDMIKLIEGIDVNLLITWCDVHRDDYLITKIFKNMNITTATLQHGHYGIHSDSGRLCFLNSESDFFLCMNYYTYELAMKLKLSKSKYIITGFAEDLERRKNIIKIEGKSGIYKSCGIALSSTSLVEENFVLLKCADILWKKYKIKSYVRPHPNCQIDMLKKEIDDSYIFITDSRADLDKFICGKDIMLVASTTVYISSLIYKLPTLRYAKDRCNDLYEGITSGVFYDLNGFEEKIDFILAHKEDFMNKQNEDRKKLFFDGDVKAQYINFIEGFQ